MHTSTELVKNLIVSGNPTTDLFHDTKMAVNGGLAEPNQTSQHPSELWVGTPVSCGWGVRRVHGQTQEHSTTAQ